MRKAIAAVGVFGLTGLGLALPASPASAAPAQALHETITFDVSEGEGAPGDVEATGAISGSGINETTSSRDTGHANHSTELQTFEDGTLTIKDSSHGTRDDFDPETCTANFASSGPFKITGGTGAYAGARGHGFAVVEGEITFAQTADGCNFDEATGTVTVDVNGRVKL